LKDLAKWKFEGAIKADQATGDLPLAIPDVYGSTPEDDRGPHDLVLDFSHANLKKLSKTAQFLEGFKETADFAGEMVLFDSDRSKANEGEQYYSTRPLPTLVNSSGWHPSLYKLPSGKDIGTKAPAKGK
jgi:hypothetical protein